MKNYWRNVWPVCVLVALQACSNANRNGRDEPAGSIVDSLSDTTQRAQAITADVNLNGDGKVFALSAATGGLMEVEAATLAIKKSKDKAVKDFATRMLKDHALANQELSGIAEAKGLQPAKTLPEESAAHLTMLGKLADREFDIQYIRMMIADHQKTLQLFTDGSRLADAQLKAFAVNTLPIIQQHYDAAVKIGKQLNISNANNGDDVLGLSPEKGKKK